MRTGIESLERGAAKTDRVSFKDKLATSCFDISIQQYSFCLDHLCRCEFGAPKRPVNEGNEAIGGELNKVYSFLVLVAAANMFGKRFHVTECNAGGFKRWGASRLRVFIS